MKKRVVRIIMFELIMLILVTGCQRQPISKETKETVTPSFVEESNVPEADKPEESREGNFNIEEVRKKLWLNGKQFSLPCTIEDLGEGYYYDGAFLESLEEDINLTSCVTGLYYKNFKKNFDNKISVFLKKEDNDYNKMKIYRIKIKDSNSNSFLVDTVGLDSTKKEVEKKFGKPDEILEHSDLTTQKWIYRDSINYIELSFNDKEKIDSITFMYIYEEDIKND